MTRKGKKQFSSFGYAEAFKQLGITELRRWVFVPKPVVPSDFYYQSLERMQCFDLKKYEESKKLLIDLIFEEAIQSFTRLKIWKGANLEGDACTGYVDYLIAERKAYLEAPFMCVVEAKKDDFEQGLAQCLVEMQACRWQNQQLGRDIEVLGVVTNGDGWQFYRLTMVGEVYESALHGIGDIEVVLGWLHYVFQCCEHNLLIQATA